MDTKKISKHARDEYESFLTTEGEDSFYNLVIESALSNKYKYDYPELMLADQADAFFALFRRSGNANYFRIGKILRKAAHKLYRDFSKNNENYPVNKRFLRLVK